jgi:hypothetical protein
MYMTCMVCVMQPHLSTNPLLSIGCADMPTTCCTHAVEVCLKSNSNANPAEIKALVERYVQKLHQQQLQGGGWPTRLAGQLCMMHAKHNPNMP